MESVNGAEGVTASLAIVEVMLKRLRRCLDLNSDVGQPSSTPSIFTSNSSSSSTQSNRRRLMADDESSKKSSVALILDAMFNGIRMERVVWQAWNVMIHAQCVLFTGAAAGSRPPALDLDLVVLILLFHHEPAQKAAERTLKKCVKAGFLTSGVVKSVFKSHAAVLSEYLKPIVKMANTLLQSGAYDPVCTVLCLPVLCLVGGANLVAFLDVKYGTVVLVLGYPYFVASGYFRCQLSPQRASKLFLSNSSSGRQHQDLPQCLGGGSVCILRRGIAARYHIPARRGHW